MMHLRRSYCHTLLLGSTFILSACGKCKEQDLEQQAFFPQMEAYFGILRNGSWWVYDSDSGSHDSLYVTDFTETMTNNLVACHKEPVRTMLFTAASLAFDSRVTYSSRYPHSGIHADLGFDVVYYRSTGFESSSGFSILPSVEVAGTIYSNVLRCHISSGSTITGLTFAPGIGPVEVIVGQDTLQLTTYHVQ